MDKVKYLPGGRNHRAHLVTEAQRPMSEDISHRERRYLIMMAIRIGCFLVALALFVNGAGWFALVPAVGAVVIPYFAVVVANGGREPSRDRGLLESQRTIPASRLEALEARQQPPLIVGYVTSNESQERRRPRDEQPDQANASRDSSEADL